MSSRLSVSPFACPSAWNSSASTGRTLIKSDIWVFFENLSRKFKFHETVTRITGTLLADKCILFIISRSFLPRMKYVSHKSYIENRNTYFVPNNFFFFLNRAVYETMWKHFVKRGRSQMKIWGMGITCWIPRATNTHSSSGYVILIAFALQQCFHERASTLHIIVSSNLL